MLSTTILAFMQIAQSDLFQYSVRHALAGRHDYVQFSSDGVRALALVSGRFERINLSDGSLTAFPAPTAGKSTLGVCRNKS